jgi:hypothetical protein
MTTTMDTTHSAVCVCPTCVAARQLSAPEAAKRMGRRVVIGTLAVVVGLPVLLGITVALSGSSSDPPATDACTRAYINDTAALARCYQLTDTGVSPTDSVELNRQLNQTYGR